MGAAAAGVGKVRWCGSLAGYGWLRPVEVGSAVARGAGCFVGDGGEWRALVAVTGGGGCGGREGTVGQWLVWLVFPWAIPLSLARRGDFPRRCRGDGGC